MSRANKAQNSTYTFPFAWDSHGIPIWDPREFPYLAHLSTVWVYNHWYHTDDTKPMGVSHLGLVAAVTPLTINVSMH